MNTGDHSESQARELEAAPPNDQHLETEGVERGVQRAGKGAYAGRDDPVGKRVFEGIAGGREGTISGTTEDGMFFVVEWNDGTRDEIHVTSIAPVHHLERS